MKQPLNNQEDKARSIGKSSRASNYDKLMSHARGANLRALNNPSTIATARADHRPRPLPSVLQSVEATRYSEKQALKQGYLVADIESSGHLEIERYDVAERFSSDEEALRFVRTKAAAGDANAIAALALVKQSVEHSLASDPVYIAAINAGFHYERSTTGDGDADVTHFYTHVDGRQLEHVYGEGWTLFTPDGVGRGSRKHKDLIIALKNSAKAVR